MRYTARNPTFTAALTATTRVGITATVRRSENNRLAVNRISVPGAAKRLVTARNIAGPAAARKSAPRWNVYAYPSASNSRYSNPFIDSHRADSARTTRRVRV